MVKLSDDPFDVGGSANDRRWKCLNHLTELLSEGKVEIEELVNEVQNPNAGSPILAHGFLNKGKRSPRTGKNSGPKLNSKNCSGNLPTVVCSKSSLSHKTTIKKTTHDEVPKASQNCLVEPPDRNHMFRKPIFQDPIFTCKRKMDFEKGECSASSRKISKERTPTMNFEHVQERTLPETFRKRIVEIGGCLESVVFVIEKGLFYTDVSPCHGRLSVPYRQVKNRFLESDEVDLLDSEKGIRAALVQPSLEECEITFKFWKRNSTYVLLNGWNKVRRNNSFAKGINIQLWSFRRNSELCFAIIRLQNG